MYSPIYEQVLNVNQKWVLQILFITCTQKSYRNIRLTLGIPNSTLSIRLAELVKFDYLEKFIYGSVSKPHYTEYVITKLGRKYLDDLILLMKKT